MWHKAFKDQRENNDDWQRANCPSSSRTSINIKKIKELLDSHRQMSFELIVETFGFTKSMVQQIVPQELQMCIMCAKLKHIHQNDSFSGKRPQRCPPKPSVQSRYVTVRIFLFPQLNSSLKSHYFDYLENLSKKVTRVLKIIPLGDFYVGINGWFSHWQRCIIAGESILKNNKYM